MSGMTLPRPRPVPLSPGPPHPCFLGRHPPARQHICHHRFSISLSHELYLERAFALSETERSLRRVCVIDEEKVPVAHKCTASVLERGFDGPGAAPPPPRPPPWPANKHRAFFILLCELPTRYAMRNLCGLLLTTLQRHP